MWKQGPMPPDTWGFGGVVTADTPKGMFEYAAFHGEYVVTHHWRKVVGKEILWYCNAIDDLPLAARNNR